MKHKLIIISLAVLFLIFSGSAVQAADPNFSGIWVLDAAKSTGLPPGTRQTMMVKQTGDKIFIEIKVTAGRAGTQTIVDSYTLDGKETEFTRKGANGAIGKGKRTAKWVDGEIEFNEKIIVDTDAGPAELNSMRKWTLSAGGKQLQMDITIFNPQGNQQTKRIYNKK